MFPNADRRELPQANQKKSRYAAVTIDIFPAQPHQEPQQLRCGQPLLVLRVDRGAEVLRLGNIVGARTQSDREVRRVKWISTRSTFD